MRVREDFVAVKVPATSANMGPGFDCLGIALDLWDDIAVHATTGATSVVVEGEGAHTVSQGEGNLVVRALRMGLDRMGVSQVGIRMHCTNRIPHSRGLGSSSAAIVAGLTLARALVGEADALTADDILAIGTELEGHPDNIAPALLGGATIAWMEDGRPGAVRVPGRPPFEPVAFIPSFELSTSQARSALPESVAHRDATYNLSRASLLASIMGGTQRGVGHESRDLHDLLMVATGDRLQQEYRRGAMEPSVALVDWLRATGIAAVISGAGPTVVSLEAVAPGIQRDAADAGWRVLPLHVSATGVQITRGSLSKKDGGCVYV